VKNDWTKQLNALNWHTTAASFICTERH